MLEECVCLVDQICKMRQKIYLHKLINLNNILLTGLAIKIPVNISKSAYLWSTAALNFRALMLKLS